MLSWATPQSIHSENANAQAAYIRSTPARDPAIEALSIFLRLLAHISPPALCSLTYGSCFRFLFPYHSRRLLSRWGITAVNPTSCGVAKILLY